MMLQNLDKFKYCNFKNFVFRCTDCRVEANNNNRVTVVLCASPPQNE